MIWGRTLAAWSFAVLAMSACVGSNDEPSVPPGEQACYEKTLPDTCPPQPAPKVQSGPDGMVFVPGGCFVMGCDKAQDPNCNLGELPRHAVEVKPFYIDRTEVSSAEFATCGSCIYGSKDWGPDAPVTEVSYYDAILYCATQGKRLPTEAEWEYAARGVDGRIYPWGNTPPPSDCSLAAVDGCTYHPVGSIPENASPFGVLDMAGNAAEWVLDRSGDYCSPPDLEINPTDESGHSHLQRGGRGKSPATDARTTARNGYGPTYASIPGVGLRCARDADGVIPNGPPNPCDVTICPLSYTCTFPQAGTEQVIQTCCHTEGASLESPFASASCWSMLGGFCTTDPGHEADPAAGLDQAICKPASAIQCSWPQGTISCPALWITTASDGSHIYKNGCCGRMTEPAGTLECGIVADPGCGPPGPMDMPVE